MSSETLLNQILGQGDGSAASRVVARLRPTGAPLIKSKTDGVGLLDAITREALSAEPGEDASPRDREALARVAVQAIISSARADRRVSEGDLATLAVDLDAAGLDPADRDLLRDELLRPPMLDHMTRSLRTRADTVAVYAASLISADTKDALADHYLAMLAARLGLERALTNRIDVAVRAHR